MAERPVILRGARVVDPVAGLDAVKDLRLAEGRIAAVGEGLREPGDRVVDVAGLVAAPGFCDMHVHFREPGLEYKETVASGAAAAVAGGFTAVACMANTDPVNDSPSVTAHILQLARQAGLAQVHPIAATTQGMSGERISEFGALKEAGAVAVSDDGLPVGDPAVMRRALEYSRLHDLPVIEHCETLELTGEGAMREGAYAAQIGLPGIPAASEFIAVERNIALAEITGARLHIAHLSTARSAAAVHRAKAAGIRVTAEVTPHHLILTDEAVGDYDTAAKMKPPLAAEADREALLNAIADGTADAIATDHAPHHDRGRHGGRHRHRPRTPRTRRNSVSRAPPSGSSDSRRRCRWSSTASWRPAPFPSPRQSDFFRPARAGFSVCRAAISDPEARRTSRSSISRPLARSTRTLSGAGDAALRSRDSLSGGRSRQPGSAAGRSIRRAPPAASRP